LVGPILEDLVDVDAELAVADQVGGLLGSVFGDELLHLCLGEFEVEGPETGSELKKSSVTVIIK
jgi:hypothetical protein